jgi:hypothetical protein
VCVTDQPLRLSVRWLVEDASSAAAMAPVAAAASSSVAPILQLSLRSARTEYRLVAKARSCYTTLGEHEQQLEMERDGHRAHLL